MKSYEWHIRKAASTSKITFATGNSYPHSKLLQSKRSKDIVSLFSIPCLVKGNRPQHSHAPEESFPKEVYHRGVEQTREIYHAIL
jgi:hypothetical protein